MITELAFVIIKNKHHDDWLEDTLARIDKLGVPKVHKIVVGPTRLDPVLKGFRYFEFDSTFHTSKITMKKNIGVDMAPCEHVVVQHLDMYPSLDFYDQVKNLDAERWDICTFKGLYLNTDKRVITWNDWNGKDTTFRDLTYPGPETYISGGVCMVKKSVHAQFKWNQDLGWNQFEDVDLSRRMYSQLQEMRYFPEITYHCRNWQ
jgi:hypothetical protein